MPTEGFAAQVKKKHRCPVLPKEISHVARNHTPHHHRHHLTRWFSGFGGGPFYGTGYYGGGGLGLILVIVLILVCSASSELTAGRGLSSRSLCVPKTLSVSISRRITGTSAHHDRRWAMFCIGYLGRERAPLTSSISSMRDLEDDFSIASQPTLLSPTAKRQHGRPKNPTLGSNGRKRVAQRIA